MTDFSQHMAAVAKRLLGDPNNVLSSPKEWRYGTRGSLSIDLEKGTWFDHEKGTGGGVIDLICRETGRPNGVAVEWLRAEGFEVEQPRQHAGRRIVANYPYRDEEGKLLFEVCRFEPKDFRQRAPDGTGGWRWSLKGVRRVLYRLPELVAAPTDATVFLVEGEKDADRLASLGLIATTCPGGANKWRPEYTEALSGRKVVILPDNDLAGTEHAETVKERLTGTAAQIAVLALQGLPHKGDVSDWLDAGGTTERLSELAEAVLAAAGASGGINVEDETDARPPEYSDESLALRFATARDKSLRYVAAWGRWYQWSGVVWAPDDTLAAYDLVRHECRAGAADLTARDTSATAKRQAASVASAKAVAAVERLTRSDRRLAATVSQWDSEREVFTTPGGSNDD